MNLDLLSEPFSSSQIHWRVGSTNGDKTSGMALAYLNARDVEDRLDKVCGRENWQSRYPWSDGKKLTCEIGILVPKNKGDEDEWLEADWVWKSNGAGDTDYEADKGAYSDAFKRAAVPWGIGRYLYRSPNWWADIAKRGKSYAFTDNAIKELNHKYDLWLLPGRQEKFNSAYARNQEAFEATIEHIGKGDLEIAAEYWEQITEGDQSSLWLAKSYGGMLDQGIKKIIRSTPFALAVAKAKES